MGVFVLLTFQIVRCCELVFQIVSTVMNMYTRRLEFQADAYAVEHGHGQQMIGALTKVEKGIAMD